MSTYHEVHKALVAMSDEARAERRPAEVHYEIGRALLKHCLEALPQIREMQARDPENRLGGRAIAERWQRSIKQLERATTVLIPLFGGAAAKAWEAERTPLQRLFGLKGVMPEEYERANIAILRESARAEIAQVIREAERRAATQKEVQQ
jgi:hypothetical protein